MSEKKKIMSIDEAKVLFDSWVDFMELDPDGTLYEKLWEELRLPIRKEQLGFNEANSIFTLQLKYPITTDGGSEVHVIEIKPCTLNSKRNLQNFKNNQSMDQARAMITAYTNQTEAVIKELLDLDLNRINAIILGFIMQVLPAKN